MFLLLEFLLFYLLSPALKYAYFRLDFTYRTYKNQEPTQAKKLVKCLLNALHLLDALLRLSEEDISDISISDT